MSCLEKTCESRPFCVRADLLPSYVPQRVANKILFIGESIQIFETDKHAGIPNKAGEYCLFCNCFYLYERESRIKLVSIVCFVATDRVTGHARGCAREWACPKLQSMWTRKYGFPFSPFILLTHFYCFHLYQSVVNDRLMSQNIIYTPSICISCNVNIV